MISTNSLHFTVVSFYRVFIMKKTQSKRGSGKHLPASTLPATLALSSALFLLPGVTPQKAMAQKSTTTSGQSNAVFKFFRPNPMCDNARIAGSVNNMIIFQSTSGTYFSIDSKTGDIKEYSSDIFLKMDGNKRSSSSSSTFIKFDAVTQKGREGFSIVGCDASGNTIMKNKSGELFTLDPKTGDMKFVK
jgi:hypothetical protein